MRRWPPGHRQLRFALGVLGWTSLVGMSLAIAGASIGRADVTSPSATWAATAFGSLGAAILIWSAAGRIRHRAGHGTDWSGAGLPLLATIDGWIIVAFHYAHEPTNHLLTVGLVTPELFARPSVTEWLAVKFVALTLLWVSWPWLAARAPSRRASDPDGFKGRAGSRDGHSGKPRADGRGRRRRVGLFAAGPAGRAGH